MQVIKGELGFPSLQNSYTIKVFEFSFNSLSKNSELSLELIKLPKKIHSTVTPALRALQLKYWDGRYCAVKQLPDKILKMQVFFKAKAVTFLFVLLTTLSTFTKEK